MRKWRSELNELISLSVVYARGLNYWSSSGQLKPKRLMQIGRMSALGQRTYAPQQIMSALPPTADICSAKRNVCYGPTTDQGQGSKRPLIGGKGSGAQAGMRSIVSESGQPTCFAALPPRADIREREIDVS
jgi:hypothetical protein